MQRIYEKSGQLMFLEPTSGVQDSPVRTSALQENVSDSKESVQVCFSQLRDLLETSKKKIDPLTCFLRTLKIYIALTEGLTSPAFSLSWTKSGTMLNGRLSTLPTSSLRTGKESLLSDVLEEDVDMKYFLSERATNRILSYRDLQQELLPQEQSKRQQSELNVAKSQQYAQEMIYQRPRGNNGGGLHNIAPTVTSNCYEHNNVVIKQICNIAVPCLTPDCANKRQNGRRFKNNNDPMFTLTAQDRHGVVTSGIYTGTSPEYQRGPLAEKSRTLKSNKHDAGVIIYNGREYFIRKLTPLECWRLQGWDDESFFRAFFLDKDMAHKFNIAYQRHKNRPVRLMRWAFEHQKMSDSQLYKQAGNGVTVTVIQRIAEKFSLED